MNSRGLFCDSGRQFQITSGWQCLFVDERFSSLSTRGSISRSEAVMSEPGRQWEDPFSWAQSLSLLVLFFVILVAENMHKMYYYKKYVSHKHDDCICHINRSHYIHKNLHACIQSGNNILLKKILVDITHSLCPYFTKVGNGQGLYVYYTRLWLWPTTKSLYPLTLKGLDQLGSTLNASQRTCRHQHITSRSGSHLDLQNVSCCCIRALSMVRHHTADPTV